MKSVGYLAKGVSIKIQFLQMIKTLVDEQGKIEVEEKDWWDSVRDRLGLADTTKRLTLCQRTSEIIITEEDKWNNKK